MQKFAFMKGMFYICRMFFGFRAFEIYSSARLVASCTNLFLVPIPTPPKGKGAVEGIENMDIIWLEEKESLLLQHHIHLTFTI